MRVGEDAFDVLARGAGDAPILADVDLALLAAVGEGQRAATGWHLDEGVEVAASGAGVGLESSGGEVLGAESVVELRLGRDDRGAR